MADKELLKSAMENELVIQSADHTVQETLTIAQPKKYMVCKWGHSWTGEPLTVQLVSGNVRLETLPLCIFCIKKYLEEIAVSVEEDK